MTTSTPFSSPSARASASDASARSRTSSGSSPSSGYLRGTRTTKTASIVAPRSFASAIAVATISSPMSPSFIGTSSFLNVDARRKRRDGIDVGQHADLAPAPDGHVDDEPDEQPGRAGVAGAGMRDQREHPDRERQRGADQGRQRHEDAADHDLGLGPERALEIRLLAAEPDHGELRRREGEQHAERVGAGEEGRVVLAEDAR